MMNTAIQAEQDVLLYVRKPDCNLKIDFLTVLLRIFIFFDG